MRIGLVVNPFAGLGGSVGLKGTDGPDTVAEARRRGARDRAGPRARIALELFAARVPGRALTVGHGALGADWTAGLPLQVTEGPPGPGTGTARDTIEAVRQMGPLDLLVFAGGDGTARDVLGAVADDTPILGIPCGVKMHSGVFAVTPRAAGAQMADLVLSPDRVAWQHDAEVMDIDEDALRAGVLAPRLFGHATVPVSRGRMQAAKGGPAPKSDDALRGAARTILSEMCPETLYVIGPGTSAGAVLEAAGQTPTTLGVDGYLGGEIIVRDGTEAELAQAATGRNVRLVLGVTGRQGFLLGRGNQQIGPDLIRKAGRDGLIVIASPDKLAALAEPKLLVDTGDDALDHSLSGFIRVATGANRETLMRVASG